MSRARLLVLMVTVAASLTLMLARASSSGEGCYLSPIKGSTRWA